VGAFGLPAPPESQGLQLSGHDWTIVSFEPGEGVRKRAFAGNYPIKKAIPAIVPGDVHWDLERVHKLPDTYYGLNAKEAGWVSAREWWYRKAFSLPREWKGKTVWLRFDGVDYLAEIWLNGHSLGRHEGQFTPFEFDVSRHLRYGGENALIVLIHPVPRSVREELDKWSDPQLFHSQSGEWDLMQAMRPAYPCWKSMTSAGWDWGTKIISMGIWRDVRLVTSGDVYLSNLLVQPQLSPPYSKATLLIQARAEVKKQTSLELVFRVQCVTAKDPPAVTRQTVSLASGVQQVRFEMEIKNPRLWWPNGYGSQELYALEIAARDVERGTSVDRVATTFGIRDLQAWANPDSPDNVEYIDYSTDKPVSVKMPQPPPKREYLIAINGRRIFARGANWIPCDLLFGRPRKPFYEHLIRWAALANFNLMRMWGGGVIEKQEFYDLCDRHGIMLFQEFPNAGPRMPESDQALAIAAKETREILPGLINHPSVVRYAGGNEWYRDAKSSRQMAQLREICTEVDPSRPFHDPDPEVIAQRHGPHSYDYARHYETYNTGQPLTAGPDDPLEWTEYGASGAASVSTLERIMPKEHLWPIRSSDPYWIWHKAFQAYGADNWMGSAQYLQLFGELPDLDTTVRCSQFVQAEGLRYANQSMRRHKWHRSACAFWTYNEPWPNAAHGCVVEYFGRPKMAYYYVKQSYAALDISAVYPSLRVAPGKPFRVPVFVSCDLAVELPGYASRYCIYSTAGERLAAETSNLKILPENSIKAMDVTWVPPARLNGEVVLLYLELKDPQGTVVARNLYTFGVGEPVGENGSIPPNSALLRGLLRAPATTIRVRADRWRSVGTQTARCAVEVENVGPHPALFVTLEAEVSGGARPYVEENYFFLVPGERRRVSVSLFHGEGTSLQSSPPRVIWAKAWNSSRAYARP
jgi:beta-mannosidase